jgi:hypothetical protein
MAVAFSGSYRPLIRPLQTITRITAQVLENLAARELTGRHAAVIPGAGDQFSWPPGVPTNQDGNRKKAITVSPVEREGLRRCKSWW